MSWKYHIHPDINLFVKGRIQETDANRQILTAGEVLKRLAKWPGQIIADEVGMGKTFVALSAAVSVALQDAEKRPVVIMIPPILVNKWPKDLQVFKEKCLPEKYNGQLRFAVAESTVEFLKLLDDSEEKKSAIIFLTHGAFHRSLGDNYVRLAMIQRAMHKRWGTDPLRNSLARFGSMLFRFYSQERRSGNFVESLLNIDPSRWKNFLVKKGVLKEEDDDPVPQNLIEVMYELKSEHFDKLYRLLSEHMPVRESTNTRKNLQEVRHILNEELRELWNTCIQRMKIRLPLLVLDEAHHLKNARTRFAGLFQSAEDADEVTRGHLANMFERMLFLTATPFQMGHYELCNVMRRFTAINWENTLAPPGGRKAYEKYLSDLGQELDEAQRHAIRLDEAWQQLSPNDLKINDQEVLIEDWWKMVEKCDNQSLTTQSAKVADQFRVTAEQMTEAGNLLKPMIIRHMRPRSFAVGGGKRRLEFPGSSIVKEAPGTETTGLSLDSKSLFPFLLAARLTAITPETRPVFAEGLASSYEAFLHTRKNKLQKSLDADDESAEVQIDERQHYYLGEIESFLKKHIKHSDQVHPKMSATVNKVVELWLRGEKVLVFCHFVATGRAVRNHISSRMTEEIKKIAAQKMKCPESEALGQMERIGERFDSGKLKDFMDSYVGDIIQKYPTLHSFHEVLLNVVRRYLRTPSFLIRFFPLTQQKFIEDEVRSAFETPDFSKQTFAQLLTRFFGFLDERCSESERTAYINALSGIQTGGIKGKQAEASFSQDELEGAKPETLVPNVRLANGSIKDETRQKLMLTFNTPFFPDVLIASSVMAEGVDLHLNCRYIIHHDLCWNPSTLEQRTGRVDRIGAKAEICGMPIHIYYPYIGETQDEKMYRVVMDREKWFKVVMGENFKVNTRETDRLAERVDFPESAAQALTFKLNLTD